MKIALWERNLDIVLSQCAIERHMKFVQDQQAVIGLPYEGSYLIVERAVAEPQEKYSWCGILKNKRVGLYRF